MATRHAFLIGIERYQDAGLPAVALAESTLQQFAAVLRQQGVADANLTLLLNESATRTAIGSKLRQLVKRVKADDQVIVAFIGHVVSETGQNYLLGWDAIPGDLVGTGFPLADIWSRLTPSLAPFLFLLDSSAIDETDEEVTGHFVAEEFSEWASGVTLSATQPDQSSAHTGTERIWFDLVRSAFGGQFGLEWTSASLHEQLTHEMPRALRKSLATRVVQTPARYGTGTELTWSLAKIDPALPTSAGVDMEQLKRIAFRAETVQRFKSLSGYQKGYRVPDNASPSSGKFMAKLATEDIRADIEEVYNAIREQLNFKRKDLEASTESDGTGFIRTPSFDYTITVRIDPAEPANVIWRREVANLTDPNMVRGSAFQAVFGNTFDRLVFEFTAPLDVAALVDHIEDNSSEGVKVRLASDESSCEIQLTGFTGSILIDRDTLQIEGRQTQTSASLIEQFFEFQKRFAATCDLKQLPMNA